MPQGLAALAKKHKKSRAGYAVASVGQSDVGSKFPNWPAWRDANPGKTAADFYAARKAHRAQQKKIKAKTLEARQDKAKGQSEAMKKKKKKAEEGG